ncbi:MAG: hypothetical protein ACJ75B_20440 [Flavisolibacter sp.]
MNKTILSIILLAFNFHVSATVYDNQQFGIQFEYPQNWKEVPVLEANKNISVFEAIRNNDENQFLTLVVFPTNTRKAETNGLEGWTAEMAAAFNKKRKDVQSSKLQSLPNGEWFLLNLDVNGQSVTVYNTIVNGYSYNISFSTVKDKDMSKEAEQIVNSFHFRQPENIREVKNDFENLTKDPSTGLLIPQHFHFAKSVDPKTVAPWAYSLYKDLLSQNNTDYVLVADQMPKQIFCLNVKLNNSLINEQTESLLSKFVGNQFKQDGAVYEEVAASAWDQSPKHVFLHKFRLLKDKTATTHYIFYWNRANKTDIIKIQTSMYLENEIEALFYKLILNEVDSAGE